MFRIHKDTDYALISLNYFSKQDDYTPLSDLIKETGMPQRFLARIASHLTAAGILESKEGRTGGYKLAKNLKDITLFEFLSIFENGLPILKCEDESYHCDCESVCTHKKFFSHRLKKMIITDLERINLEEVLKH